MHANVGIHVGERFMAFAIGRRHLATPLRLRAKICGVFPYDRAAL
jgi:hypothetical protein